MCFLINKRISSHSWNVNFIAENLTVLTMQNDNEILNVTNIYSSSSESYITVNNSFPIHQLLKVLNMPEKHMIVGNLNLHHKSWSRSRVSREHRMMTDLLKHVEQKNLILITSSETITCELYESRITINLIFVSQSIHN